MAVGIKPRDDILLPNVRLVPHRDGGWALPGGGVTTDPVEAARIASRLETSLRRRHSYHEADCTAARRAARRKP